MLWMHMPGYVANNMPETKMFVPFLFAVIKVFPTAGLAADA